MEQSVYREAGRRVAGWSRTMILSHQRPDADALGAIGSMKRVILAAGRSARAFIYEPVSPRYAFIDALVGFTPWPTDIAALDTEFDGVLILDTCSWSQLEPVAEYLRRSRLPKVVVDHHATRDNLTQGTDDCYAIDGQAASACGLVYEWCVEMGWLVDCAAAELILAGMAADTGWFRFSNTDPRTLRAAASLVESCQIRPDIIYAKLNGSHSPARLRLMCRMLSSLQLYDRDTIAVLELTREMFEQSGAIPADAEELVNEPMNTGSVLATLLMTDMGDGVVRLNFRSKSPELIGREIDVAAVAKQFGGGGHHRAAGARVSGSLAEVRERAISALRTATRA